MKQSSYKNKNWLYRQYWINEKSQSRIANECKISQQTIFNWMKKLGILSRSYSEANHLKQANHCNLSDGAKEWIDGELLGDAHLHFVNNYSAWFTYGSKFEEYIKYISNNLNYCGIRQSGKIYIQYDKRWDCFTFHYRSLCYVELLPFCKRWYPKGKKIVPKDIELTPLTCRQWYIGDGYLDHPKGKRNPYIFLCTEGFIISDVEWLVIQLNKLGFKSTRQPSTNGIHISTSSTKDFLDYIGSCPIECYKYKWNYSKDVV